MLTLLCWLAIRFNKMSPHTLAALTLINIIISVLAFLEAFLVSYEDRCGFNKMLLVLSRDRISPV